MISVVDTLLKAAYAEGAKQALLEQGVNEKVAAEESNLFTEANLAEYCTRTDGPIGPHQ